MEKRGLTQQRVAEYTELIAQIYPEIPRDEIKMVLNAARDLEQNSKAPNGYISIRACARKYRIPDRTLSRWVEQRLIPVYDNIQRKRGQSKYIHEATAAQLIKRYKTFTGSGRVTIKKVLTS